MILGMRPMTIERDYAGLRAAVDRGERPCVQFDHPSIYSSVGYPVVGIVTERAGSRYPWKDPNEVTNVRLVVERLPFALPGQKAGTQEVDIGWAVAPSMC